MAGTSWSINCAADKPTKQKFLQYISSMPTPARLSRRLQHHVVVSLTPRWLRVAHFRRGFIGWRRAHEGVVRLTANPDNLDEINNELARLTEAWDLDGRVNVNWVVSGDILGIVTPSSSEGLQAEIPFALSETLTGRDRFDASSPAFLWIHKDWVAELERISSSRGWELTEIFPRAQLFQNEVCSPKGFITTVLEREGDCLLFHIYKPSGAIVRSTILEESVPAHAELRFNAELRAIASTIRTGNSQPRIFASRDFIRHSSETSQEMEALKEISEFERLEILWRSNNEGIVIRSAIADVIKGLKVFTGTIASVGLICILFIVWHGMRLEESITAGLRQERSLAPKADAMRTFIDKTRQMSNALEAFRELQQAPNAFDTFQEVLAHFPPPPAALLHVYITPETVQIFGTGTEESVEWIKKRNLVGHTNFSETPTPEFLTPSNPTIHLMAKRDAPSISPKNRANTSSSAMETTKP